MPDQLQLRGGTTAQHTTFTGASKEVTVDTTKKTAVVHDGSTVGGNPLMREDASNSALALGSAATPSLKWDANTGIYSPGADQVAISTSGQGRLYIAADGKVGIGVASPQGLLHLGGTGPVLTVTKNVSGTDNILYYDNSIANNDLYIGKDSSNLIFRQANNERMRLTGTGLGVGTSSPDGRITVQRPTNNQGISGGISFKGQDGTTQGGIGTDGVSTNNLQILAAQGIYFHTGNTDGTTNIRATLDSSGRLGIGSSSPTNVKLEVKESATNTVGTGHIGFSGASTPLWVWRLSSPDADLNLDRYSGGWSSTPALTVNRGTGNVGIGTSPSELLHVSGGLVRLEDGANGSVIRFYKSSAQTAFISNRSFGFHDGNGLALQTSTADPIRFAINDSEAVRIDSSKRLLVGTSSSRGVDIAGAQFQIEGTGYTSSSQSIVCNATAAYPLLYLARSRGTTIGANTIVQNGDYLGGVLFAGNNGTSFDVGATVAALVDGTPGTSGDMPGRLVFSTTADGAASPTERMRITSGGDVLVGRTSGGLNNGTGSTFGPTIAMQSEADTVLIYLNRTSSNGTIQQFRRNNTTVGSIDVTTTATAYVTSSDYRLKENVTEVTDGITRLQQLKPSRFNFIADPDNTVDGFIAHEVQTVVPEAITGNKDEVDDDGNPVYQGIDQAKLVPLLTAALQEAIAKIESLEARLTAAGI